MTRETTRYLRIIERHDRRFDGSFVYGVKTTGVYCRPGCPAQPNAKNILLFRKREEAEQSGYRACKRCRPELSPGNVIWEGSRQTVKKAVRLIQQAPAQGLALSDIAKRLLITPRHLRRLFEKHLGISPMKALQKQRLDRARQQLRQTQRPIIQVAFDAGFQSIRQFNAAFKERYRTTPSYWRHR